MKDLPASERPRERLEAFGPASLSNVELLAVIIRTGDEGKTAIDLAWRLLRVARDASGPGRELVWLAGATCEEIRSVRGIGYAKAAEIKAAIELGKRAATCAAQQRPSIRRPSDVGGLFVGEMKHLDREQFHAVLLNTKNQVLGIELVSIGSLNESIVHPREVFRTAIRKSAAAIILVHNHPVLTYHHVVQDRFVSLREAGIGWPGF
jgi:DNA repair protein RadC